MHGTHTSPKARLPRASGGITRLACERLQQAGIPVLPLLRKSGVHPSFIEDRQARLAAGAQIRFLNEAANAAADGCIGFHLAQDFDLREIGLLYYVIASSETLGEGLRRGERYTGITNESISLKCFGGEETRLRFAYLGVPRHEDRHQIEFLMTALIRICGTLTGALRPRRVSFAHRPCDDSGEIERYFDCPVEFGAALDEATFAPSASSLPLLGADPHLNEMLVRYCEEALASRPCAAVPVRADVENAITPLLPHGRPAITTVARRLGMSTRTLARRLAAEGLTFAQVLDELRTNLAWRYLSEQDLSMSRIAWLLGYQEVSAFTHACRRWTGKSPTEIRATGAGA
jgi:AraC-like DNA-binding protein